MKTKTTRVSIIVTIIVSGLLFGATIHPDRASALSDSSSTEPTSQDTSQSPTDPTSQDETTDSPTGDQTNDPNQTATDNDTTSNDTTTPCSNPSSSPATTDQTDSTLTDNTTVNDCLNADAQSGDASVTDSTLGGSATTGSAADTANIINAVDSSGSLTGGNVDTTTQNISGNVNGDITIDPPSQVNSTPQDSSPVEVNGSNNSTINNEATLNASSGNATVANNAVGGNATSGPATTEANIINLLDSTLSSGQNFIEILNIYGNLEGDIVLPQQLVSSLLSNSSTTPLNDMEAASVMATNQTTINNDINLIAISGDATVEHNLLSGNATTGSATTDLSIYNFTGSQIIGGNVLLVFVNVMGSWVGLLLNDPAGTTNAALGGQIEQDLSPSTIANATLTNTDTINNYVDLSSTTGGATVTYNNLGGNATSGNATAIADVVNIVNTNISLSGWLGILIINVFGTWDGSLVIQSPVYTVVASNFVINTPPDPTVTDPKNNNSFSYSPASFFEPTSGQSSQGEIITTATKIDAKTVSLNQNASIPSTRTTNSTRYVIAILIVLVGLVVLGAERYLARHQSK